MMFNFDNALKKPSNLLPSVAALHWAEQNQEAIKVYNDRIAVEGTFAQQVNKWLIEQGEVPMPGSVSQRRLTGARGF